MNSTGSIGPSSASKGPPPLSKAPSLAKKKPPSGRAASGLFVKQSSIDQSDEEEEDEIVDESDDEAGADDDEDRDANGLTAELRNELKHLKVRFSLTKEGSRRQRRLERNFHEEEIYALRSRNMFIGA